MDQLVFLLIVGAVAFVKWLVENAGQNPSDEPRTPSRRDPDAPRSLRPDPGDASRAETEAERMRRFMEALGLPPDAVPPSPQRKPPTQPQRPAAPVSKPLSVPRPMLRKGRPLDPFPRPVAPAAPQPRPHIAPPIENIQPLPTLPKTASVAETAPSMEVTSIPQMTFAEPEQAIQSAAVAVGAAAKAPTRSASQEKPAGSVQAALREDLRGPDALRRAILLREILSAPKGLQSAQSPTIFSPL